jgi:hypothetical protein
MECRKRVVTAVDKTNTEITEKKREGHGEKRQYGWKGQKTTAKQDTKV